MTETRLVTVSASDPEEAIIAEAARILDNGGLVAFPTETVYGLGADAFSESSISRVFQAKGRPSDNPLIVHIGETTFVNTVSATVPEIGWTLARTFWPGPLTLVVPRADHISDLVTAGLDTVAVRMPNHPVALSMIRKLGRGIVAPSANLSGYPSPTTARHVQNDLNGRIDLILDGGETRIGVESTVLDITQNPPVVLRTGGLSREAIEAVIGPIDTNPRGDALKRSPGLRYKHYAPRAEVRLVNPGDVESLERLVGSLTAQGKKIGCILHSIDSIHAGSAGALRRVTSDAEEVSHSLFALLRELDELNMDLIIVEGLEEKGLGVAVMDRLRRASSASGSG